MSNLLQKASIITTPTAYDTGKILSVKPVQYYGPELVTNGDFQNNVDSWSNGNSGVNTWVNGHLVCTGTGSDYAAAKQIIQAVANKKYLITAQIARVSGSFQVGIEINDNNGSGWEIIGSKTTSSEFVTVSEIITTNTGTTQLDLRATIFNISVDNTNSLKLDNVSVKEVINADFDFTRNSSATRVGSNGLIQDVASNLPRIDYTGGVGSWKFEPQRTNSVTYSEDFSQWQQSGVTITPNSAISPDGTLNADKIIATTTDPAPFIFANVTATEHTFSFYYKGEGNSIGKQARVLFWFIGTATGTTTSVNFIVTGDWQRFENQITPTGAGTLALRIDFPADLGAVGDYGYLWGAQLEQGSYATSYIPTSGSATTRLADAANNAGSSNLINSTQGVLYAEISALADDSTNRQMTLSDGTNTNRLVLKYDNQSNIIQSFNRVGGVESAFLSATILDITLFSKCLVKYKENDYQLWINGYKLDTDTNSTVWPSSTLNDFKINEGGGADFFGNVKSLSVFKEALTDLELECLVSWMSFSDLGINFGYTVE